MNDEQRAAILRRRDEALRLFVEHPESFMPAVREAILANRVIVGMRPYDCYLAAGAFAYKVQADTAIWPPSSDPLRVLWAQTLRPDNSQIWMSFETDTQFPGEGLCRFRVHFRHGAVARIEKLT